MKESMDSTSVQHSGDEENFANRKLIRPALPRVEHNHGNHISNHNANHLQVAERRDRNDRNDRHERPQRGSERADRGSGAAAAGGRKAAPTARTNAENFYYQNHMQAQTPKVIDP